MLMKPHQSAGESGAARGKNNPLHTTEPPAQRRACLSVGLSVSQLQLHL